MKKCMGCNIEIDVKKKRCVNCSLKQRKIIYDRAFQKRNETGKRHVLAICTFCKKEYKRDAYSKGNPFCSSACKGVFKYNIEQVERQKQFEQGKLKYRNRIKAVLLEQFSHVCQICKNTTWNNHPIPLQVDHIDGKSNNNMPNNLRLICHNCDALLPTFAGKNRGKGRGSLGLKAWE